MAPKLARLPAQARSEFEPPEEADAAPGAERLDFSHLSNIVGYPLQPLFPRSSNSKWADRTGEFLVFSGSAF